MVKACVPRASKMQTSEPHNSNSGEWRFKATSVGCGNKDPPGHHQTQSWSEQKDFVISQHRASRQRRTMLHWCRAWVVVLDSTWSRLVNPMFFLS
jgi:hypothetical protein